MIGLRCIALTDHVDSSNLEEILQPAIRSSRELPLVWPIVVLAGCEITHAPLEHFPDLVGRSRKVGAQIVLAHGETTCEPVVPGTNRAAILAGVDILAHPGLIMQEDVELSIDKGVALELSLREKQFEGNIHLIGLLKRVGLFDKVELVVNSDSHSEDHFKSEGTLKTFEEACFSGLSAMESQQLKMRIDDCTNRIVRKCLERISNPSQHKAAAS